MIPVPRVSSVKVYGMHVNLFDRKLYVIRKQAFN